MSNWLNLMSAIKMKNEFRRSNQKGFTFLEVMIALSLIAIVLVSVYRLQSQTILMSIRSRFDTLAPFLAQQKLSEIEGNPNDTESDSGTFEDAFSGYHWQVSVAKVTSEILGRVVEGMKQIDVTISFQDGNQSYHLRVYRLVEAK